MLYFWKWAIRLNYWLIPQSKVDVSSWKRNKAIDIRILVSTLQGQIGHGLCWCFRNAGVFPKLTRTLIEFNEFSKFKESDKPLKHELSSIQRSCLSHVSCWCCGSILVSYTGCSRFETFYTNDKYFCNWI